METEWIPTPQQDKSRDWTISETLSSYTEMATNRKKVIQLLKLNEKEWEKRWCWFFFMLDVEYGFVFL